VDAAPAEQREFREAVHTILTAIAADLDLQNSMVMKGGLLMAIRYKSNRFTTDLDFSSSSHPSDFNIDEFREKFEASLAAVVAESKYDLDCRIQRFRMFPKTEKPNFASIKMTLGYAHRGSAKHKRLLTGNSPTTIDIDFSINEPMLGFERLNFEGDSSIHAYVFTDLVAEKFRSLLQQPSRDRFRRQDVYDLRWLINSEISDQERSLILESLKIKSQARQIVPNRDSLDDPEVKRRAEKDYPFLADEVPEELPDFQESYELVSAFYKSLPW